MAPSEHSGRSLIKTYLVVGVGVGTVVMVLVASGVMSGKANNRKPAANAAPVPATVARRIRTEAGTGAYLPTYLPPGFRYRSWKAGVGRWPLRNGETLFTIHFRDGAAAITWWVESLTRRSDFIAGCRLPWKGSGLPSGGEASVDGRTAYWSPLGSQVRKGLVGKAARQIANGRNYWTCPTPSGDHYAIIWANASDEHLPTTQGAKMIASSSDTSN